jgi:hypothetical protein
VTTARAARLSILARLQLGLEALYRVDTQLSIDAFLIDAATRDAVAPARAPREQLLIRQAADDELDLGLFVDASALDNLERHDPGAGLDDRNFSDFCLALEGVSHFVYVALAAARSRPISHLELELQAEVDKFACCVLLAGPSRTLRARLYGDVRYADDLDGEERARYRTANDEANRYATALERRYVTPERTTGLLGELRRFYRMDLAEKLGHIARVG